MDSVNVKVLGPTGHFVANGVLHISSGIIRMDESYEEKEILKVRTIWTAVDYLCHRGQKVVEIKEEEIAPEVEVEDAQTEAPGEVVFSAPEEVVILSKADLLKNEIATYKEKARRLTNKEKKELAALEAELTELEGPKLEESPE